MLTIEQKCDIITQIRSGKASLSSLATKYGVGRSTISDIKRNAERILRFRREKLEMGMSRSAKIVRAGEFKELDKALFVWLKPKRAQGIAVTRPLLCEKALELSKLIYGDNSSFSASEGWRWRFGKRHGIHELVEHGEQLSADRPAAESFVESFRTFVLDENFSNDQIFNCNETGLNFRLLPNRTLATASPSTLAQMPLVL